MFIFMDLDDVDNITPIRSCRSYFVSTALSYDAIFAHCGFSADGLEYSAPMLANLVDNDDVNINEDNGTGFRFMEYPYSGGVHSMTTTRRASAEVHFGKRHPHRAQHRFL